MAEPNTTLEKIGLTRGKASLIGVLAVALVAVIYGQYGPESGADLAPPAAQARPVPPLDRSPNPGKPPTVAAGDQPDADLQLAMAELDQDRWQSPDIAEVIIYDPFALPAAFPQPPAPVPDGIAADGADFSDAAASAQRLAEAVERLQTQLEELQQRGVHVIVNRHDEYVAMIGDRTLHVGDEINGFTVTAINPNGVHVERKGVE